MKTHPSTIDQVFAWTAVHSADLPAILAPGREPLSHRRLADLVAATAIEFDRLGIGRGDRVALLLTNGPELATAILSVAAAAIAVPLNPVCSAAEFDFSLLDLTPRVVLVDAGIGTSLREVASARGIPLIELVPVLQAAAGTFEIFGDTCLLPARSRPATPDDIALVLHTSGTTAQPKIVPITQANLCASARNIAASLKLSDRDRALNVLPLFHVYGLVATTLAPLAVGGSIVCTAGFEAAHFLSWLQEFEPTWYAAGPTVHQAILTLAKAHPDKVERTSLRFIRSASDALAPHVLAELERIFRVPVIEAYGMTEAASMISSNPLPPGQRKLGSVGLAAGVEIAILDEAGRPVPAGETGEVAIRGENVMRGYEGDVAANAMAFTNGWLRTGDIGYLDEERYLFLTGRLKEMINRGGEKICPSEIDKVLMTHPAIAHAVTFAVPHATLGEDVAAAVVLHGSHVISELDIQKYVGTQLSHFKVPRRVMLLDTIPTGPVGKVQRIGLATRLGLAGPSPDMVNDSRHAAPRTPVEKTLAEIWKGLLGVEAVGLFDNFFQLGGDSISAMLLISDIHQTFHVDFGLVRLFETPNLESLAVEIVELQAASMSLEMLVLQLGELESTSSSARPAPSSQASRKAG